MTTSFTAHHLRVPSCLRDKTSSYVVAAALALTSCNRTPDPTPPAPKTGAPAAIASPAAGGVGGSTAPHGDHTPHHGGIVMMKGDDLHYEVVLDPAGQAHRVYFTDAVREELPASVASDVVLTIRRPSAPDEIVAMKTSDEIVAMQIDDAGESWVGRGRPVANPLATTARLAFSIRHEPYWIELPFGR